MLYILIVIIGGILSYFLPWWVIAPVIMALSFWKAKTAKEAAATGALAATTLWIAYATFLNFSADVSMVDKVAGIFAQSGFMASIPKMALIFTIITIITSAVGGLAGMAGVNLRTLVKS